MLLTLVKRAWSALLAAIPAWLLVRLDAWARHDAERRAERRRTAAAR